MSREAEMGRGSVSCERTLISPWSMYRTILIFNFAFLFRGYLHSSFFEKHTVIYVAGSLLYSNNVYVLCGLHVFIFLKKCSERLYLPGQLGIAQFPNFPPEEYVSRKVLTAYIYCV